MKKSPLKPVNPQRRRKESLRAYGPKERRAWIAKQDCVVCGRVPDSEHPNQNAHIKPDPMNLTQYLPSGTSRKEDARWVVPLCPKCHRELDEHPEGQAGFEREYYTDLNLEAVLINLAWLRKENGVA